jgi:hypothetical protein
MAELSDMAVQVTQQPCEVVGCFFAHLSHVSPKQINA